ncbi:MAG TPA: hypothetical protein VFF04_04830 [Candidatus Babeliales bacterium]|nr:hypothetical protein [Candidatus Babeliales bacterium]
MKAQMYKGVVLSFLILSCGQSLAFSEVIAPPGGIPVVNSSSWFQIAKSISMLIMSSTGAYFFYTWAQASKAESEAKVHVLNVVAQAHAEKAGYDWDDFDDE